MTTQSDTPHSHERFYKYLLLCSSLVALVFLVASAFVENYSADWRQEQREYRELLFDVATDDNSRRIANRFRIELQQVVLPEIDRVDRCLSCHLGVDNPRMEGAPQPFSFHSGPFLFDHPVGSFGCTLCHRGQGRSVVSEEAKYDEFWGEWLLPLPYTQASCGVCHDALALESSGAPGLARGFRLFKERGCRSCHRVGDRGGNFGPALDDIGLRNRHFFPMAGLSGEHTIENWLYEHFLDPQEVVPGSRMKKTPLTDEQARDLTIYMLSLQDVNLPREFLAADKYKSLFEERYSPLVDGEMLYNEFCFGCHEESVVGEEDDILEKEIPAIRNPHYLSRLSDSALELIIRRGRPGTEMPAWNLDTGGLRDQEIKALVDYLAQSREYVSEETFEILTPQDSETGEELYADWCSDCHGEAGRGDTAPSLMDPIFQEVYDDRLLGLTIRDGIDDTGMDSWGSDLTVQEISDIIAYIRTLGSS